MGCSLERSPMETPTLSKWGSLIWYFLIFVIKSMQCQSEMKLGYSYMILCWFRQLF